MEHNKDQSGAVASEKPQFPWNPDPINHEWTQPEIAAIHAFGEGCFQAGVSSVQSRAAVRGEAVADAATDQLYGAVMNIPCKMGRATEMHGATKQAYKEGHRDARHAAADLIAAFSSSARAADALDSQPTVTSESRKLNGEQVIDMLLNSIIIESGARVLLNGDTLMFNLVELIDLANTARASALLDSHSPVRPIPWEQRIPAHVRQIGTACSEIDYVKAELAEWRASSQPTDGGVRK